MKKQLLFAVTLLLSITTYGQENLVGFSGGWVSATPSKVNTSGYKLELSYEFAPAGSSFSNGAAIGFLSTQGTDESVLPPIEHELTAWPVYYAPKFSFGGDNSKGFLKGAIGWNWSKSKETGPILSVTYKTSGLYAGLGAGGMYNVSEKVFINLEYEWAYMGRANYDHAFVNAVLIGIGMKF